MTAKLFGHDVVLPVANAAVLAGKDIVVGLRPEHISAGAGQVSFAVSPRLIESLGSEQYVYVDLPEEHRREASSGGEDESRRTSLIARLINPEPRPPEATLTLSFDPVRLHVFDAASGEAIR